jgi:hypothetical protein
MQNIKGAKVLLTSFFSGFCKEICGVEYTSKLNKMFTDVSLSSDLNANFKDYIKSQPSTKLKGKEREGEKGRMLIDHLFIHSQL